MGLRKNVVISSEQSIHGSKIQNVTFIPNSEGMWHSSDLMSPMLAFLGKVLREDVYNVEALF